MNAPDNTPSHLKTIDELLATVQQMDARVNNASSRVLVVEADMQKLHAAAKMTDLTYYLNMEDIRRIHQELAELYDLIEEHRQLVYQVIRNTHR